MFFSATAWHAKFIRTEGQGRARQVDPIERTLKAPGPEYLKLEYDKLLSTFAFKFNLRRFTKARTRGRTVQVEPMKPTLKAPGTQRLKP